YTRTVFEVQVVDGLGSQNAIGGGGRYDKLAEEVGGRQTPGLGFALGYERCVLALQAAGVEFPRAGRCDFFIACVDDSVRPVAFKLLQASRDAGLMGDMDHQSRSLKSQFKLADKLDARVVFILGPDELSEGKIKGRNMVTKREALIDLEKMLSLLSQFGGQPYGGAPSARIEDVFPADE
ncbi:MAG: His/Gly/Thr/Pro-type tRNA ligase C-terminal domain-containing protein, partial [Raoultibacter sp.]